MHCSTHTKSIPVPWFCSLLSRFEYIYRRACLRMSWTATFPSKLPLHVWGSAPHTCAQLSPHRKRYLDWFRRFCIAHGRGSLYFTVSHPSLQIKILLRIEYLCSHVIYGFLGPPESTTQTASRSVQPFLQSSRL